MQNKHNFAFWGTPDVAAETLEILKESGFLPSLIITSPDKPVGRKMIVTPTPVKVWATTNNIPFLQPEKLNDDFFNELSKHTFDLLIVVAYGKIIPEKILNLPKIGSINIHYSLLPKYRGASPVESAILGGETKTGVSIQKMVYEMDAGDILAQEEVNIIPTETAPELRKRLIQIGGKLLVSILPTIETITPVPQTGDITFASKIKKEDGLLDLNGDAATNYNKFRAYAHWPRTYFFKEDKRVIVTQAKLEDGKFIIEKIIPEGGKEIDYQG